VTSTTSTRAHDGLNALSNTVPSSCTPERVEVVTEPASALTAGSALRTIAADDAQLAAKNDPRNFMASVRNSLQGVNASPLIANGLEHPGREPQALSP
jgi:hypothetical protein